MLSNTQGSLYIVETAEPFERLEIQFFPDEISNPREAHLSGMSVVSRNNDILQYTGGEESLKLPLDFFADEVLNVVQAVNWLKSLTMNDGENGPFRNVKIVFGDLFKEQVWAIKSVNPVFSMFDEELNMMPLRARCEVNFILNPVRNLEFSDYRKGSYNTLSNGQIG